MNLRFLSVFTQRAALEGLSARGSFAFIRGDGWGVCTALIEHIVETHHYFTRREIDRLVKLFDKVCSRHGENHPELFEAQQRDCVNFHGGLGNYPQSCLAGV